MDPIVAGALGELIAEAVASTAGWSWSSLRSKPQARRLRTLIDEAVADALASSALPLSRQAGDAWVGEVAAIWRSAFTAEVSMALAGCLADPSSEAEARFADLAMAALQGAGCDLEVLGRGFWVDEFLAVLPRRLFAGLRAAALQDSAVDQLVGRLLAQRADARVDKPEYSSPSEFRSDLIKMMDALSDRARFGQLPGYLPAGADVSALTRTVRVRLGIRSSRGTGSGASTVRERYRLASEQQGAEDLPQPWSEVSTTFKRVLVLGDPGVGKSWLIRTETIALAREARARLEESPGVLVIVPVPLRCDQLDTAPGADLGARAAASLAAQGLLAERSRDRLTAKIRAGEAVLLLDALDELTPEAAGRVRELLGSWMMTAGGAAGRCVITSRISGYMGPPAPGMAEVELRSFSLNEVTEAVAAWPSAHTATGLLDRLRDPAVGAMARIPLVLALLCSLATRARASQQLPRTRGELYERVLRWFLTGTHRSPDSPAAMARDDIAVDAMLEILAPLAMTFATKPEGWVDLMPGSHVLNAIRATGTAFTEQGRPAAEVLRELSSGVGVLIPDSDPSAGRSPSYLFLHRTFAEYLVARHLAALPAEDWLAVVEAHRWFDPDWAEVIPMLAEQLSPSAAATLIKRLAGDKIDPFNHSLLAAARAWGARPDADHLLPAPLAADLADRLADLLMHPTRAAISQFTAMTFLPQPLLMVLLARLSDADGFTLFSLVRALASRDSPAVMDALLGKLNHSSALIRAATAQALAGNDSQVVTEALLGKLADDSAPVRNAVSQALAGNDSQVVTEALLGKLAHSNGDVRTAAIKALVGRNSPEVTGALLATLAHDTDSGARMAAVSALAGRSSPEVTGALLARLSDENPFARVTVVNALADRKSPDVTEVLLARLIRENEPFVKFVLVGALAGRNSPEVTEALLARLTDDDGGVRAAAAQALAGNDSPAVIEGLLVRLTHSNGGVRAAAAQALAGSDSPAVAKALLARLSDDNIFVQAAADEALAGRDTPEVTEALLSRLTDSDKNIRAVAVRALAGRDSPGIAEALLPRLTDDEFEVRRAAAKALAESPSPQALLALAASDYRRLSIGAGFYDMAEQLMSRHYLRIPPEQRPTIRTAMAQLTATVALHAQE